MVREKIHDPVGHFFVCLRENRTADSEGKITPLFLFTSFLFYCSQVLVTILLFLSSYFPNLSRPLTRNYISPFRV